MDFDRSFPNRVLIVIFYLTNAKFASDITASEINGCSSFKLHFQYKDNVFLPWTLTKYAKAGKLWLKTGTVWSKITVST